MDIVALDDMNADEISYWLANPGSRGPGYITLGFETGISNGDGYDFAVFENAFGGAASVFAELGYVEVSSNGVDFARFDSVSLTESLLGGTGKSIPRMSTTWPVSTSMPMGIPTAQDSTWKSCWATHLS